MLDGKQEDQVRGITTNSAWDGQWGPKTRQRQQGSRHGERGIDMRDILEVKWTDLVTWGKDLKKGLIKNDSDLINMFLQKCKWILNFPFLKHLILLLKGLF